jgi:hypothetical protein
MSHTHSLSTLLHAAVISRQRPMTQLLSTLILPYPYHPLPSTLSAGSEIPSRSLQSCSLAMRQMNFISSFACILLGSIYPRRHLQAPTGTFRFLPRSCNLVACTILHWFESPVEKQPFGQSNPTLASSTSQLRLATHRRLGDSSVSIGLRDPRSDRCMLGSHRVQHHDSGVEWLLLSLLFQETHTSLSKPLALQRVRDVNVTDPTDTLLLREFKFLV